jgi:hypothetical protein
LVLNDNKEFATVWEKGLNMTKRVALYYLVGLYPDFRDDRTIMSPFVNPGSFYPKTSLEKLRRTALPLTEIPTL